MTIHIASPPFVLDYRVATSPLVGLRFLLDGRIGDLETLARELEDHSDEATAQRARIRALLREHENQWQALLAEPGAHSSTDVARSCARAMDLCAELGRLDEVVAGSCERVTAIRKEAATLGAISAALGDAEGDEPMRDLDSDGVRYTRAERHLYQLIEHDHAATTQKLLTGPVQRLADAVTSVEVIERLAARTSQVIDDVHRCRVHVSAAHAELQRLLDELLPAELTEGLAPAVRAMVRGLDSAIGRCDVIGEVRRLRPPLERAVFRIAQEAVANAVVHGRAEHIDVALSFHAQKVTLIVRDDGDGFDVAATEARLPRTQCVGLLVMRQRAELEGGSLDIRSILDHGTEVRAIFSASDDVEVAGRPVT